MELMQSGHPSGSGVASGIAGPRRILLSRCHRERRSGPATNASTVRDRVTGAALDSNDKLVLSCSGRFSSEHQQRRFRLPKHNPLVPYSCLEKIHLLGSKQN